ncbi:MAG: hypothetical protein FRX48_02784 [Lasallia pustulata]|uniref:Uncharacterized protein n=1 Tax=Lasallia pustulata TaxID=136370 RepID=A0A5M8PVE5_9LECA|nr:MAG: hypothetical protein FRX48_02784 [Lasallia pustulata]
MYPRHKQNRLLLPSSPIAVNTHPYHISERRHWRRQERWARYRKRASRGQPGSITGEDIREYQPVIRNRLVHSGRIVRVEAPSQIPTLRTTTQRASCVANAVGESGASGGTELVQVKVQGRTGIHGEICHGA